MKEYKFLNIFYAYSFPEGNFWFRLFGYGLAFSKNQLFSDRYFNRKRIFGYYVRLLKPPCKIK